MITGPFYAYRRVHFHQRNFYVFVIFACNYPREPHVTAAIWPYTHLFRSFGRCLHRGINWIVRWVQSGPDLCLPYRRWFCCAAQTQAIQSDELYRITTTNTPHYTTLDNFINPLTPTVAIRVQLKHPVPDRLNPVWHRML